MRLQADCQTTFFGRFKRFEKILKKVAERSRDSGRGHATLGRLSNNVFWTFQAIWEIFWKKSLNGHATVVGGHATVGRLSNNISRTFQAIWENLEKVAERSRDSGWCHATVGRLSNNVFWTFQAIWKHFEKVAERSRDSGRRSRDRRPTVKQRFLDFSSDLDKFWKKSLNGHATVVEGHATVGRLSNNVSWTFQAIWENFEKKSLNGHATVVEDTRPLADCQTTFFGRFKRFGKYFEKSRWTVTRQWSEVTRPSADCQTTFFGRFKRFGEILKKVAERSRDSGWGHATVGRLSNNVSWTFQAIWENFEKSRWTVTRQWLRSRDRRPIVKQRFWTFQAIWGNFEKIRWTVTRQWLRSRDRRPTVKQRFLDVSSDLGKFWKKSLNGHATVVEVTRPSADFQTTFSRHF